MKIKSNEELWDLLGDVEKFNKFLSDFEADVKQQTLLLIPDIVVKHLQDQYKYRDLVKKFYKENPELIEDKALVGNLMNKVAADHPDWEMSDVFDRTAETAKAILGDRHARKV